MKSKPFSKNILFFGSILLGMFIVIWLSVTIGSRLLEHREHALKFIVAIESIKPWLILFRLMLYASIYIFWAKILKYYQPDIANEQIADSRRMVVRFMIVYELFFGFDIINWLTR